MSSSSTSSRLVYGKDDVLFGCMERLQADKPWGDLLDAGTGLHSLRWIATLPIHSFTAVTADTTMQRNVEIEAQALGMEDRGRVVKGNWFPPNNGEESLVDTFGGQQFDTILADYLIGAMDGFSPYQQDLMIPLLTKLLKPQGRLYIVGLEPIPDRMDGPGNIVCRVRQVRDACILLAGHRCYREYPLQWVQRQITSNAPDLQLLQSHQYPILYKHETIVRQINVGRSKFSYFTPDLATAMGKVLDELEQESLEATQREGKIQVGFDYVVAAERI